MNHRDLLRLAALPFTLAVWLAVAPAAYAGEPTQGVGTFTVSFSPVFERMANGNTFLDYTFVENSLGIVDGTRIGTGELVIHADGSTRRTLAPSPVPSQAYQAPRRWTSGDWERLPWPKGATPRPMELVGWRASTSREWIPVQPPAQRPWLAPILSK